ncbi:MAG: endolytic transglycosylase MltG [Deltaproteobacteria bacterium CG_4_10_14_0_2_um_filter_43_8]|nr:MAG: endolytic transglycosylase MltG [Deltaproteobacteria bacterium CG_4_10_14_0_2_um_filter_43_8]
MVTRAHIFCHYAHPECNEGSPLSNCRSPHLRRQQKVARGDSSRELRMTVLKHLSKLKQTMNIIFKILKYTFFIAFLFSLVSLAALYGAINKVSSPAAVELEVQEGSSVKDIAQLLKEQRVVKTPHVFRFWIKVNGWENKMHAGVYHFEKGVSLSQVARKLYFGDVIVDRFQIIEGKTLQDVARSLAANQEFGGKSFAEDFLSLAYDKTFLESLGLKNVPSLEGYLLADTYKINRPKTAKSFITQIYSVFQKRYEPLLQARARNMKMSVHQVLTLASIVEKETGVAEERPVIAGVFLNRLQRGMLLQSDPTIIYGLKQYDGNIRKKDITDPHPFNTYVHAGLPLGPICSVGKEAIEAVLAPAKTQFLYFVSKNDGSHYFSSTLTEHLRAVHKYQIEYFRKQKK